MIEPVTENIIDELTWRGLIAAIHRSRRAAHATSMPVRSRSMPASTRPDRACTPATWFRCSRSSDSSVAGHRPIVLAGGATGLIGDPRDVGERTMNSADTVAEWAGRIRGQLERFVDFDDSRAARSSRTT